MRAKVVIPALGLAFLLVAVAVLLAFGGPRSSALPSTINLVAVSDKPVVPTAKVALPVASHVMAAAVPLHSQTGASDNPLEDLRQEYATNEVARLQELATSGGANALATIVSDLSDRDVAVRRAAVAAAVEFGDRGAIPALQEAMESNLDPQEQVSIRKAIAYLQLPTLAERDNAAK